jgi:hypothetical protein
MDNKTKQKNKRIQKLPVTVTVTAKLEVGYRARATEVDMLRSQSLN